MKKHIRVVNMIPRSMSGETNQDSEPQLTVDPHDRRVIVGTTFTPDPGGGPDGPVFASFDHGQSWTLDLVIPGGPPNDQSVRFGHGRALYAGVLRGDVFLRMNILRSAPYSPISVMQTLVQRDSVDQPYLAAITADGKDRLFVGDNDSQGGSVDHSADARTAPPPAGFSQTLLDQRSPIRDSPSIRPAPHRDGTVYAAYFSWTQGGPVLADVVVARDDNFGTGGAPFTALTDGGDGKPGVRVVLSAPIPWFFYIGNERVGSSLSIAVDPRHSRIVYLCWGDDAGGNPTLHVRRSTDRGATWSGDVFSVANATNPALAITESGRVGFLYQVLTGSGASQRWETHVQITRDAWSTPAEDIVLANTPVDNATYTFDPYIGDYDDLQAVGDDLYGIFSAHNQPDKANFPHGVHYQRNANFVTHQLLNVNGVTPVADSIDPFFFHIRWERDEDEGEEREDEAVVRIRGLRYERIEIEELTISRSELKNRLGRHRALRSLGHRLAELAEDLEEIADGGHDDD